MNTADRFNLDQVFRDAGRILRSTPFKVFAGVTLLAIALLMGATQGHIGGSFAAKYTVVDKTE